MPIDAENPCLSHQIGQTEDKSEGIFWIDVLSSNCNDAYEFGVGLFLHTFWTTSLCKSGLGKVLMSNEIPAMARLKEDLDLHTHFLVSIEVEHECEHAYTARPRALKSLRSQSGKYI
jgi:hypothetical protein